MTFNLTVLDGQDNPKINKISQEAFKAALVDFPRDLAEKLVELGYGKWLVTNQIGNVLVPVGIVPPEQLLFVKLRTHAVKAVEVSTLLGGEPSTDLVADGLSLHDNRNFTHDPADLEEGVYDEDEEEWDLEDGPILEDIPPVLEDIPPVLEDIPPIAEEVPPILEDIIHFVYPDVERGLKEEGPPVDEGPNSAVDPPVKKASKGKKK